jgi:predicted O-methyltransferase YrrM
MKTLMAEIERVLPDGGQWCSLEKAQALAALVIGLRPRTIVEIGVWMGGSAIPMLLALKKLGAGKLVAIDPWDPAASVVGETPDNATWWGNVDHDRAYLRFVERMRELDLSSYCEVLRKRSDDCLPPDAIDLLHVDGSHTEQATRDVARFCPLVRTGGIAVLDDVDWHGGHVSRGVALARSMGFADLYPLGTGLVMHRRAGGV